MNFDEHRRRLNKIKGVKNENVFDMAWNMVRWLYRSRWTVRDFEVAANKTGRNSKKKISERDNALQVHAETVNRDFEEIFRKHWKDILA